PSLADGAPYSAAVAVLDLAKFSNLYLKLTPRTVAEAQNGNAAHATFFPLLVSKFGASRIAWGSNYPASEGTLPELLKVSQSALAVLSAGDRDWIFSKTALTLYPALIEN
ncbi:MAG TPA: amidohydrolase family protein, partial [Candidatus Acidoferrales bacterium]|nr:amidohydrolase family protein [Candidatus Acidoferrales bacterium]